MMLIGIKDVIFGIADTKEREEMRRDLTCID